LVRNSEVMVARAKNHKEDARQTPMMKAVDMLGGSVALNPPSNSDPSIMACGLNQAMAKQIPTTSNRDLLSASRSLDICGRERIRVIPMYMTNRLPDKRIIPLNTGKVSTKTPTPKKQAKASDMSKNIIMNAI